MSDQLAQGIKEEQDLRNGGFGDDEIAQWKTNTAQDLQDGGFDDKEVKAYFGYKEPDMAPVQNKIQENFKNWQIPMALPESTKTPEQHHAESFLEAIKAGFQMSSSDMAIKAIEGKSVTPDTILPEDASTFYRIASQVGTLAGDVPAMMLGGAVGGLAGAAAGSEVPVVGTVLGGAIGTGAGANALPEALRSSLMNYYEKGEIHNFQDFWERTSATFLNTLKSGVVGGATFGVGNKVGKVLAGTAAPLAAAVTTKAASEVATMVTLGKAMEGQVPSLQDFTDGAIIVGMLHGATSGFSGALGVAKGASAEVAGKLREIYAKTGVQPHEIIEEAKQNPVVLQDLLVEGKKIPEQFDKAPGESMSLTKELEAGKALADSKEPTANEQIRSKIAEDEKPPGPIGKAVEIAKDVKENFYQNVVDKFDPIKQTVEKYVDDPKSILVSEDPYKQGRMTGSYSAKWKHMIKHGMIDFNTLETTGKSLEEALSPVYSERKPFEEYAASRRVIELHERGIDTGFNLDAAKKVVAESSSKYESTFKDVTDFSNGILKYLADSGRLSKEEYNAIRAKNEAYIPFNRVLEEEANQSRGSSSPIHAIEGSTKDIKNPISSIIDNTQKVLKFAETNRARRAFVDLVEETGALEKLEKGEIAGENAFSVWRDGVKETYKVSDPALAESLKALDGNVPAMSLAFQIAKSITTLVRFGATTTPDFIVRNGMTDQATASVFSQGSKGSKTIIQKALDTPIISTLRAVGDNLFKTDAYWNWMKSGGAGGSFNEINTEYLQKEIFKLDKESGGFLDKSWNVIKSPIEFLKAASELVENSTRLGEFKKVAGENPTTEDLMRGGFASREVTVDFQRMGAKISAFNAITAFQNASIQGVDRTIRAIKEDPTGVAVRAAAYITVPSVLLWWAQKDDPRYQEIPRWQRDLYFNILTDKWEVVDKALAAGRPPWDVRVNDKGQTEVNNGKLLKFRKPQELGLIFGTLPERLLEKFVAQNPRANHDLYKTITGLILPNVIPDAFTPIAEHMTNRNTFLDRPIVNQGIERLLPQYQYTSYTSETAKQIGKMIAVVPGVRDLGSKDSPLASPMVIDNYIHGWTGGMGQYALQILDAGLKAAGVGRDIEKPTRHWTEGPVAKAFFTRNPTSSSQSIQDFLDRNSDLQKKVATMRSLVKQYDLAESQRVATVEGMLQPMTEASSAISHMQSAIRGFTDNPKMTGDDKRQAIDGLIYMQIQIARLKNQQLDQMEKFIKTK